MKKFFISGTLAFLFFTTPASSFALTGFQNYTNYNLYANHYNNATAKHAKETNNQYISNIVTKFINTSKATFWASDTNSKKISKTYDQKLNNMTNIYFTSKKNKGSIIRMGMENAEGVSYVAQVSGRVNFR